MAKRTALFLLLLLVLLPMQGRGQDTDPSPATFRAAPSQRTVELTGYTRPAARISLISEEEGRCRSVALDVGGVVGKEGVFASLEETFLLLDLERNRTEQERVRSELGFQSKELDRHRTLAGSEAVSQSALDSARYRYEQAVQQLAGLEVQERTLQERLARHVVKAPSGWTVIARDIEPGQWVARGQRVGEVGDFRTLKIPFALTIEELAALEKQGTPLRVSVPDLAAHGEAVLETVSPDFDPQTRKVHVELKLISGEFQFRGGVKTVLRLDLPEPGAVFLLPERSILTSYEEEFLVRTDGSRVRVIVLSRPPGGMVRAASSEIAIGEEFLLDPVPAVDGERP
jgi:RND family efflux transporter MFP subunit